MKTFINAFVLFCGMELKGWLKSNLNRIIIKKRGIGYIVKVVLWVLFFVIALGALYIVLNNLF